MTYNTKNRKAWSINANRAKEKARLDQEGRCAIIDPDLITIEITRKATGEHKIFTLMPGSRCDNYTVDVDGVRFVNLDSESGCFGIHALCQKIAKALPRFRSESSFY